MTNVADRQGEETRHAPKSATRDIWRTRRMRGQSLVEFALIAPIFFVLFFSIIEFSLINASIGAFNFAAKDGARFGAITGKGSVVVGVTTVPTDQYIVNNVILPHVSGVVVAQMTKVEVYNSTETGACVQVAGSCQEDIWQLVGGVWTSTSNSWPSSQREDALSNADYLGVRIQYSYTYLTAMFAIGSPTLNLSAESIQRIEPQQYGDRSAPSPGAWASEHAGWWTFAGSALSFRDLWARLDQTYVSGGRG